MRIELQVSQFEYPNCNGECAVTQIPFSSPLSSLKTITSGLRSSLSLYGCFRLRSMCWASNLKLLPWPLEKTRESRTCLTVSPSR